MHPVTIAETIASVPTLQNNCDDTLHTPHIFPSYSTNNDTNKKREPPNDREPLTLKLNIKHPKPIETIVKQECKSLVDCKLSNSKISTVELTKSFVAKHVTQPVKILPKRENVSTALAIHSSVVLPIAHQQIIVTEPDIKQKLKAVILKNSSPTTPVIPAVPQRQLIHQIPHHEIPVTTKMTNNSAIKQRKRISTKSIKAEVDERSNLTKSKRVVNEGNREAAKRYRNRMKQKNEAIINRNEFLADENRQLRSENKRLKQILAQHLNCSVTQAHMINIEGIISPPMAKIACPCDSPCNIKCEDSASN